MDPLTIGFENALHEANLAPTAPDAVTNLVAALRAVIESSPHRARGAVSVAASEDGCVELRKNGETYVLEHHAGRWRLRDRPGPAWSGPEAAALTEWLTS